jgi:uncharacterized protein (DUF697 family)
VVSRNEYDVFINRIVKLYSVPLTDAFGQGIVNEIVKTTMNASLIINTNNEEIHAFIRFEASVIAQIDKNSKLYGPSE